MPRERFQSVIPLFKRARYHSFVPARTGIAAVRSMTLIVALAMATGSATAAQTAAVHPASMMELHANPFAEFVAEAARRFAIPASWVSAVIQAESNGDSYAVSPKGAMGLMQLMPETWAALRARNRLGANPFDPHDNILAGTAYLRQMYERFGKTGFLAAYNAGPGRYENHLTTGRPLPAETQKYLAKITHLLGDGQTSGTLLANSDLSAWTQSSLFVRQAMSGSVHGTADNASTVAVQTGRMSASHSVGKTFALAPQSDGLFVHRAASGELP